jgi:hypothetical protein
MLRQGQLQRETKAKICANKAKILRISYGKNNKGQNQKLIVGEVRIQNLLQHLEDNNFVMKVDGGKKKGTETGIRFNFKNEEIYGMRRLVSVRSETFFLDSESINTLSGILMLFTRTGMST